MHRWHAAPTTCLSRSKSIQPTIPPNLLNSISISLRQFQISALRAQQEAASDQGPATPSKRTQRIQNTTREVQRLFDRTTASSPDRSPTAFRSLNLSPGAANAGTGPIDARSLAAKPTSSTRGGFRGNFRGRRGGGLGAGGPRGRGGGAGRGRRRDNDDDREGPERARRPRRGTDQPDTSTQERQDDEPERSQLEMDYLDAKSARDEAASIKTYNPDEVSEQALERYAPAMATSHSSMAANKAVEGWFEKWAPAGKYEEPTRREDMANAMWRGEFVKFRDEEEREAVLASVQKSSENIAERISEKRGVVVEPREMKLEALSGEDEEVVLGRLVSGVYKSEGDSEGRHDDVLEHLRRSAERNESYMPADGMRLVEKVRSLLPAAGSKAAGRGGQRARA